MKTAKKSKGFGLGAVVTALVFLFNPNFNIIDILPDFIGYIILCAALSRLSDMNEDISVARRKFSYMIAADVAKLACIFITFSSPSADERNTMLLLIAFAFAVIEAVLLIPAIRSLFGGIMNLGYKFDNTSVLGRKKSARKNYTEKIRSASIAFVAVKAAAYTLPEFAVLTTHTYDEGSRMVYIYDFIGLLRAFAFIVALIVGIVWLVCAAGYFNRLRKDEAFISALDAEYAENVAPRTGYFVRKDVRLASALFFVASLLFIDFRLEYFNVIPDVLGAAVLIGAAIILKKRIPDLVKYFVPFLAYAVLSLVATLVEYNFFTEYYYSAIIRNDEAYRAYCVMLASSMFDVLGFILAIIGMSYILKSFIKDHTGFFIPDATINAEDKIKKVHNELNKKMFVLYAGAFLCAASDIFYDFFADKLNFAGFVNFVCTLVFIGTVYYVTDAVGEEVDSKYILD